jgi:hypothetical protein
MVTSGRRPGAKNKFIISLEERGSLALLVATNLKVLAPLELQFRCQKTETQEGI